MNTGGRNDEQFDKDLAEVSEAYRRVPSEEPPALLDQAILGKARRAVESKSIRPWNFGWIHAVTTAAVVVLALAILMERPQEPQLPVATPERGEFNEKLPAAGVPKPVDAVEVFLEDKAVAEEAPRKETFRSQEKAERLPHEEAARADEQPLLEQETAVPLTEAAVRASADARDQVLARRVRQADSAEAHETTPAEGDATAAPAREPTPPAMDAAEPAAQKALISGTVGASDTSDVDQAGADAAGQAAGSREARQAETLHFELPDPGVEDPETWLARILELKRSGENEAFEAELEAFREAWPDYPLPPELESPDAAGSGG